MQDGNVVKRYGEHILCMDFYQEDSLFHMIISVISWVQHVLNGRKNSRAK